MRCINKNTGCVLTMIHSGQVFKGTWNKTDVALKVFKNQAGVNPSSAVSTVFLSLQRHIFIS